MRAINLYTLTRNIDEDKLSIFERLLSDRDKSIKIDKRELITIKKLFDLITKSKEYMEEEEEDIKNSIYENWFYSFTIPKISKEFDLLKIGADNEIINIELKSEKVDIDKIKEQLYKNRYYLSHLGSKIFIFTCMLDDCDLKVFRHDGDYSTLPLEINIDELLGCIKKIKNTKDINIEDLFRPRDYLVSPFNDSKKFLKGEYYLTGQQDNFKKEIIENVKNKKSLWTISGAAGTGKTLLLYDIAKTLSADFSVGIIHCGNLNSGHNCLNNEFKKENINISIIDAKKVTDDWVKKNSDWLNHCEIVCIDETQRIFEGTLKFILETYDNKETNIQGIIFSYDPIQKMSISEIQNNNLNIIKARNPKELNLSGKIRTNTGIYFFIKNMMDLKKNYNKTVSYTDIDIVYADDKKDFVKLRKFYEYKGYTFIAYTPANKKYNNSINKCLKEYNNCYMSSHDVIGQEFDKVSIVVDNNFFIIHKKNWMSNHILIKIICLKIYCIKMQHVQKKNYV